ncbi:VOC family protein [Streptomyces sp. TRM43335]|uniref:VOC family protein n=1 Tax=Streptomyces taklimakanensis TaxID=2569853 RepID=A0A6G2BGW2_9ACTN|nr:VOC family protein [Streptomyces taklimakanensis]MTE21366.1 VOC family protein [Streptomyces taklimakanensis]
MSEAATRRAPGTPCWVSLLTGDPTTSRDFYRDLFGWEYQHEQGPTGPHFRAVLDGRDVACIRPMPKSRRCLPSWSPFLASDDADKTAETVRLCGGTVGVGPLGTEGTGRVAVASDPAGAPFGIWQDDTGGGAAADGGPGTVVWNELITYRTSAVEKFYRSVFDLDVEHPERDGERAGSEESDYLTVTARGRIVGGIRGVGSALPRDRGAHWLVYVEVEDTDTVARRATELGGEVLVPPGDSPYGRTARLADREGVPFAVISTER